jgi:putative SOS response-associated peptidase YedK
MRQTYNFAPGMIGLIYRADTSDYGAGPAKDGDEADGQIEQYKSSKNGTQSTEKGEEHYKLQAMKWGLVPFWTKKSPDYGSLMRTINCRDDSLLDNKGMWTSMKKRKRCVVVCQGFYEWLKKNNGKERIPHYIKRKDGQMMCFAGLWDVVKYDDDEKGKEKEKLYTYTIITTDSNKQLKFLHDRMPVILTPGSDELRIWLDPVRYEWSKELQGLLKPWDGELEIYPVGKDVGKVGNDSPSFIVPVDSAENKSNIANFFKNTTPKKEPSVKQEVIDDDVPDENSETHAPAVVQDKAGSKRDRKTAELEDTELKPSKAVKIEPEVSEHAIKTPPSKKMHDATRNGNKGKAKAPAKGPNNAAGSKKITTFFKKDA